VLVARSKGVDITAVGSGNPGASNVGRVLGRWWGVFVFALDALKGAIPASVGLALDDRKATYVFVTAAVLGHMFPATRRFVGGKGVATLGGAMLVLQIIVSLVLLAVWLVVRKVSGKASLASIAIAAGLPIGVGAKGAPGWEVAALVVLAALVMMRHIDNIRRLIGGRELAADKITP
jgi:acyl phosphate:glycerol-3-phosphate acyltransferase